MEIPLDRFNQLLKLEHAWHVLETHAAWEVFHSERHQWCVEIPQPDGADALPLSEGHATPHDAILAAETAYMAHGAGLPPFHPITPQPTKGTAP